MLAVSPPNDTYLGSPRMRARDGRGNLCRISGAFAEYRVTLRDVALMSKHIRFREWVFVPVRPLDCYADAFYAALNLCGLLSSL